MNTEFSTASQFRAHANSSIAKSVRRLVIGIVVAASTMLIAGCGAAGFPVTGVVIDSGTKLPMANVWVAQVWRKHTLGIPGLKDPSMAACSAVQVIQTNAQGQFRFESPPGFSLERSDGYWKASSDHRAHIVGYENDHEGAALDGNTQIAKSNFGFPQKVKVLVKKIPTREQTLEKFFEALNVWQCLPIVPAFKPVEESLMRTLVQMGVTPEEFADAIVRYQNPTKEVWITREYVMRNSDRFAQYNRLFLEGKAKS